MSRAFTYFLGCVLSNDLHSYEMFIQGLTNILIHLLLHCLQIDTLPKASLLYLICYTLLDLFPCNLWKNKSSSHGIPLNLVVPGQHLYPILVKIFLYSSITKDKHSKV